MSYTPPSVGTALTEEQRAAAVISPQGITTIGALLGNRPVVLVFFPAAFTSVCTTEVCTFRDSMARFNGVDAGVYGLSIDTPFTLAVFAEQNKLNFPLLSDANREATRAFGVVWPDLAGVRDASNRAVFVIDSEGAVAYAWVAENPGQEPHYDAVIAAVDGGNAS